MLYFFHLFFTFYLFLLTSAWDNRWIPSLQAPLVPWTSSSPSSAEGDADITQSRTLTLRSVYHRGTHKYPDLHRRLDINPEKIKKAALENKNGDDKSGLGPFIIPTAPVSINRLRKRNVQDIQALSQWPAEFPASLWNVDEVSAPDVANKSTVVGFAIMAADTYQKAADDPQWIDVMPPFNLSSDIGWEEDGLRGHVYADETNSTIVIAIKGTTSAVFDGADTTTNDKENDNLFAGCCCGQGSFGLRQVCDCMTGTYTCNENCVAKAIKKPNRYYQASIELYGNITEQYPNADIWLTGHSLGGLVSTLLGLTFGQPVLTFEAVPQALAVSRLDLPSPPGFSSAAAARGTAGIWNFGHTADPVYMGTCNGAGSLCAFAGYALESQCHTGLRCVYDVVADLGWSVSLSTHGIRASIKNVYKKYESVPTCVADTECVDCFSWKREKGDHSTSSISKTTSTKTRTRTETCKTPGWWGCRDTTSPTTTYTSTTVITTTSCQRYGWFGACLDPITTTSVSKTTIIEASATVHEVLASATSSGSLVRGYKTEMAQTHQITASPSIPT
ncbi:lipase atg15 protein [Rutstroemia sp. NJR-2017a BVV2]|nr:lipase atg15 protein [Rutstroemia sp. NJR-2017a BVV2]PQE21874.1 lipase atg15 protein [Rutstroemia sp. NJR-2017a BVV2]